MKPELSVEVRPIHDGRWRIEAHVTYVGWPPERHIHLATERRPSLEGACDDFEFMLDYIQGRLAKRLRAALADALKDV